MNRERGSEKKEHVKGGVKRSARGSEGVKRRKGMKEGIGEEGVKRRNCERGN